MNQGYSKQGSYNKMYTLATANKNKWMELSPEAGFLLLLIIFLMLIGANKNLIGWAMKLFSGVLVGMIISVAAGNIIQKSGGKNLKKIFYTRKIWKFNFSITAFAIATFIVEFWLFK